VWACDSGLMKANTHSWANSGIVGLNYFFFQFFGLGLWSHRVPRTRRSATPNCCDSVGNLPSSLQVRRRSSSSPPDLGLPPLPPCGTAGVGTSGTDTDVAASRLRML
jgi:hypothetical protein